MTDFLFLLQINMFELMSVSWFTSAFQYKIGQTIYGNKLKVVNRFSYQYLECSGEQNM